MVGLVGVIDRAYEEALPCEKKKNNGKSEWNCERLVRSVLFVIRNSITIIIDGMTRAADMS